MNPWTGRTCAEMLDASARRWPDQLAIVDGEVRLSFRRLTELRDSMAEGLKALGIGPGTRVATLYPDSWPLVVLYYALLKTGAVITPLNLTWEKNELIHGVESTEAEFLFVGSVYKGYDLRNKVRTLGLGDGRRHSTDLLPYLRYVHGVGSRADHPLVELLEGPAGTHDGADGDAATASEAGYSFILFTSGSSGRPKPAMIREEAMLGSAHHHTERLGLSEEDRFLNVLPLYHTGGIVTGILSCQMRGATMYLFSEFDGERMIDVALAERCTATNVFDAVLRRLLVELEARGEAIPFAKMGIAPGNHYATLEDRGMRQLVLQYAMTEASNMVSITDPSLRSERGIMSNGFPLPGVEVKIRDAETHETCGPNTPGEICYRGWNVFAGYYGQPEATAERFDADGFFASGDYGWLDEDGRLFYRGRYSMMIKTGGENVSEVEVEDFLTANLDYVVGAAVVGAPDEEWGEVVVAFVEVEDGVPFDPERIYADCRGNVAGYKIPKRYIEVRSGEWPVTVTGKIDKTDLRRRAADAVPPSAPLTPSDR